MKKIPVGATIAHAYRFAFANALTVLKAIWLPLLAQLAVILLLTKRIALFMAAAQARDPSAASLFGPLLLLFPLALIFFFAQFTAATETALGRPPQSWLAFHFDKVMWRLVGGFLTALAAITAVALVGSLIIWLLSFGLDVIVKVAPGTRPVVAILAVLLVAAYFSVLILACMRFLFLLAPVNVSEQQLGVRRAWELSAGNFWRALLVTLAIMLPVMIINYAYVFSLAGLPPVMPNATKEAREAADMAWRVAELNIMAERWYLTLPLTGLLMLFQFATGCAAQAFAYRALTDGSAPVAGNRLPD
jgi:hypothetical protein